MGDEMKNRVKMLFPIFLLFLESAEALTVRLGSWNSGQVFVQDFNTSDNFFSMLSDHSQAVANIICSGLGFGSNAAVFIGTKSEYFNYMEYPPGIPGEDLSCMPDMVAVNSDGFNLTTDGQVISQPDNIMRAWREKATYVHCLFDQKTLSSSGSWSDWGESTHCTNGRQQLTRHCNSGDFEPDLSICEGPWLKYKTCSEKDFTSSEDMSEWLDSSLEYSSEDSAVMGNMNHPDQPEDQGVPDFHAFRSGRRTKTLCRLNTVHISDTWLIPPGTIERPKELSPDELANQCNGICCGCFEGRCWSRCNWYLQAPSCYTLAWYKTLRQSWCFNTENTYDKLGCTEDIDCNKHHIKCASVCSKGSPEPWS